MGSHLHPGAVSSAFLFSHSHAPHKGSTGNKRRWNKHTDYWDQEDCEQQLSEPHIMDVDLSNTVGKTFMVHVHRNYSISLTLMEKISIGYMRWARGTISKHTGLLCTVWSILKVISIQMYVWLIQVKHIIMPWELLIVDTRRIKGVCLREKLIENWKSSLKGDDTVSVC